MENKQTLLTICIPTYNRKEKIQRQVRSILPQLTDEVLLIVNDNCSSYDIRELFTDKEKTQFVINVNRFNIGGDANIAKSFLCCNTKWLWTLSDDDTLAPNAINTVLEAIKLNDQCIFINFNKPKREISHNLNEFLLLGKDYYSDLFWMSICVYNLDVLKNYMHYYFPYISAMQPNIVLFVKTLHEHPYDVLFSNNQIIDEGDKDISWNRSPFIFSSLFVIDILRDYKKEMKLSFIPAIVNMCLSNVLQKYRKDRDFRCAINLYIQIFKRIGGLTGIQNIGLFLWYLSRFTGHVIFKSKN